MENDNDGILLDGVSSHHGRKMDILYKTKRCDNLAHEMFQSGKDISYGDTQKQITNPASVQAISVLSTGIIHINSSAIGYDWTGPDLAMHAPFGWLLSNEGMQG